MKKFLLSAFIIITFIAYALYEKISGGKGIDTVTPNNSSTTNQIINSSTTYKDGEYIGETADAFYGNVQVKVIVQGGKISDVQFLDYPRDRGNSVRINNQAMPILKAEAIQVQNSQVDIVTGATQTSQAFVQSLQSALIKAKG